MRAGPNILLVTTDQQRFDSLGCTGNPVVRTPTVDGLAGDGIRFDRCQPQNVLCTPSRATILTGQHVGTHGVWGNGVALPADAPSVAQLLNDAGYATALLGKLHLEPFITYQARLAAEGRQPDDTGPHRGFEHLETVDHFRLGGHWPAWARERLGEAAFQAVLAETLGSLRGRGGDTGAYQAVYSALPAEAHNTTWTIERTLAWIDEGRRGRPFFAWVSLDDPHHPFNPPAEYGRRHDWRELPLPDGLPRAAEELEADLDGKPWQYRAWRRGELGESEGAMAPTNPCDFTDDQLRELTALTYGMVELIDDQLARLLDGLAERGLRDGTHVFFTTDHGELLGDHGLLLKGPFHVDGLLRIPLIWNGPGVAAGAVTDPVGLVDLAPTFCSLAGVPVPEWMDGAPLPTVDGHRERVLTQFDSAYVDDLKLRSLYRDGWLVTAYPHCEGVGELYDVHDDPLQRVNRWGDPAYAGVRDDLLDDLRSHLVEDARSTPLKWWAHA